MPFSVLLLPEAFLARPALSPLTRAALSPFAFAGLGFTWRVNDGLAVGVQVEGNTTAFRDVDFLHRDPASAVLGLRTLWGPLVLETGLGAGFDWSSSYQWMGFLSIGLVF